MYDGAFPCSDVHKEPPNLGSRKTSASLSYNRNDFAIFCAAVGFEEFCRDAVALAGATSLSEPDYCSCGDMNGVVL